MGVIQQQTIKGTVYSFIGVVIGFVNLAILSPMIFTSDQIGLTQVMIAISTILAQLGSLGFNNVTNRLFPYFRSADKGHNGYLSLTFLVTAAGFVLCLIALSLYMPSFIENNWEKSALLSEFAWYIPALVGIIMLFTLLDNYCKVLFNAVIGTFLREVVLRTVTLLLVIGFFFGVIDFSTYVFLFVISQGIPVLAVVVYLIYRGEFRFTGFTGILNRSFVKQIISLSFFGIIAGLSGIAMSSIDKYMVNAFKGLGNAGVYSIAVYFATLILIPARSLGKIAVPVVSEAWKNKDMEIIQNVYYKSSINQLLIGLLIFVGIIDNLNNIFRILPPEYAKGEMVIVFFGLANILNAAAGSCKIILSTSAHYKYQTYLMIIFIMIVITSNLILIPAMGITGAAIASLISMFMYTGLTVLVLWKYYKLWPFGFIHVKILGLGSLVFVVCWLIPEMPLVYDILLRSFLIVILFVSIAYIFKLSDDMRNLFSDFSKLINKKNQDLSA